MTTEKGQDGALRWYLSQPITETTEQALRRRRRRRRALALTILNVFAWIIATGTGFAALCIAKQQLTAQIAAETREEERISNARTLQALVADSYLFSIDFRMKSLFAQYQSIAKEEVRTGRSYSGPPPNLPELDEIPNLFPNMQLFNPETGKAIHVLTGRAYALKRKAQGGETSGPDSAKIADAMNEVIAQIGIVRGLLRQYLPEDVATAYDDELRSPPSVLKKASP